MKSYRVLTVYLTLATLLFGNVAGWVHLGCTGHQASCCAPASVAVSGTAHDDHGGHGCYHHDHGSSCHVDSLDQSGPTDDESESKFPAKQHDPDKCAVCQGFFASRHAVVVLDAVACIESLSFSSEVVLTDDVFAPSHLSRSHTVRAPPSV